MNRAQAARELGLSKAKLASMERSGTARPTRDERRVPCYTDEEVARLRTIVASMPTRASRSDSRTTKASADGAAAPQMQPHAGSRALLVRSQATMSLVDEAERLETATRVAEARRKLAALDGTEHDRHQELERLRARNAAHVAAAAAERQRQEWRHRRISEVLHVHGAGLAAIGVDASAIVRALTFAIAVLNAQSDLALAGPYYPDWLVRDAISAALQLEPPAPLMVPLIVHTPAGPAWTWRDLVPGD